MTRHDAALYARQQLDKNGLTDWHVRINTQINDRGYLGLCVYDDKCIIINAHHVETHPEPAVKNTILHEVAHALMPGHQHNQHWAAKAREIGCDNTRPCSNLSINPAVLDAIRSGAEITVEFETSVVQRPTTVMVEDTVHTPKYTIHRLQDKCKYCGKPAIEVSSKVIAVSDPFKPDIKFIKLECGHTLSKTIAKGTPFHTLVSNYENRPEVRNCKHDWDKNKCLQCGEFKPFDFQVEGMRFAEVALSSNKGALIADEMGLGKTIQGLGYFKFHPECFPLLFVVKSGSKYQVMMEILRWLGNAYVPQIIQSGSDLVIPGLKCYIISYDMMTPKVKKSKRTGKTTISGFDPQKLIDAGIKYMLLDETQQIKNQDSTRTQQVRKLAKHMNVIGLSGTPWKNRASELFTILNMIAPQKFPSFEKFCKQWVDYYWHGNKLKEGGIKNIPAFQEYTKELIIRRQRVDVMKELPEISRLMRYVELDNLAQRTYDDEVSDFVKWYNEVLIDDQENSFETTTNLMGRLQRMRHITALAKVDATLEDIKTFVEDTDRKLVVFVHHIDVGETLMRELKKMMDRGEMDTLPLLQLAGGLDPEVRFEIQNKFNQTPRCIMIASTLAAGESLNLQTCADCIIHERQWNPANEEQAEGRFIRIGQTALAVNASYQIAAGTVDDILTDIVERKRVAFHKSHNKGEIPAWRQSDIISELVDGIMKNAGSSKMKKLARA